MEMEDTPTYKKVGLALSVVVDVVEKQMEDSPDGIFSFEQMCLISKVMPLLLDDSAEAESVKEKLLTGLNIMRSVGEDFPEVADEVAAGAQLLVMGMFQLVSELADRKMISEAAKMAPLAKHNSEKERLIRKARTLAQEMWREDGEQKIRIGEMTANVYSALYGEGHGESLPSNQDAVKDWIRPVAPAYARKGGKPRKTP
ncbi:TPA: hypothetical protein L3934_006136 [Pseudomonas aeruginosa]|uniref:hypothetical protein n=1 Tax=Pseudomonas aeruginosa TaxID=287 RepID=UPI00136E5622|nr:hypothetical protein [Pseudomonas aeruginosa]MXU52370.1 hypothetical protein [Pseudomonas aeruginosa]HBN9846904.1 hypothetical protein [Pseudomonas aeruginosa]HBN9848100.1 hypothetical protein [Pseudomonas aeruginosa]